jgi:uncharacterized protein YdhG (YjbR/CyaY superfamily)
LEALRQAILEVVPDAEQCMSYGMPAFKLHGKVVAPCFCCQSRCSPVATSR